MSTAVHSTLAPSPAPTELRKPERILSVDLLRGITIAFMVLVNDPGDWSHVFKQLDHSEWNGCTLTDLVFPMFLFLVGAATVFSLEARERQGNCKKTLTGHIFWRATKLFLLKTALSLVPLFHWSTMRIYGVLTRIALCYLLAGLVLLTTRRIRTLLIVIAALLIGYWILLRWVPVPGAGMPVRDFPLLDRQLNLTAWLDRQVSAFTLRWLHTGTLYLKTSDPEGLLSTLTSVATTLCGAVAGLWMRSEPSPRRMRTILSLSGMAAIITGVIWSIWFPLNKNLWTSSYVLFCAGISAVALAACSALVDRRPKPWPRWLEVSTWPWFVFGANAIAAYTTSVVVVKTCALIHLTGADGKSRNLWSLAYIHGFSHGTSNNWTSLAFAIAVVIVCFMPNWFLWHKRIFWKI